MMSKKCSPIPIVKNDSGHRYGRFTFDALSENDCLYDLSRRGRPCPVRAVSDSQPVEREIDQSG